MRFVQLANHFGRLYRHRIISLNGSDEAMGRYGAGGAGAGVAMSTTIFVCNLPMDIPMKGRKDPMGPTSSEGGASVAQILLSFGDAGFPRCVELLFQPAPLIVGHFLRHQARAGSSVIAKPIGRR